jgi:hypothetical protein
MQTQGKKRIGKALLFYREEKIGIGKGVSGAKRGIHYPDQTAKRMIP